MKWMLAGVAAIAIAAAGAVAQPGNGNGNGGGNSGGNGGGGRDRGAAAQVEHGNGHGNGNGQGRQQDRGAERGGQARAEARDKGPPADRGNGNAARGNAREVVSVERGNGRANNADRGAANAGRDRLVREGDWRDAPLRYVRGNDRDRDRDVVRYVGLLDSCPPGLAAKNNGCQPPGEARKTAWLTRESYDLGWWGLPRYDDGFYRYSDGYLLRLDGGGGISGWLPLLGGALTAGNPWPAAYGYDRLDPYYTDYYGLGPSYRYADNVLYRLDPETAAISSIAALLTGDDFAIGAPMPPGYDVYNVPYDYRDRYYDTDEAMYRYSDGYVYEVDPTTRLIVAAIELLA